MLVVRIYTFIKSTVVVWATLIFSPILFSLFFCFNSAYVFIYKLLNREKVIVIVMIIFKLEFLIFFLKINDENFWKKPIKDLSKFWMFYASLWHGHEIIGFDNIPDDGSALIIMFHAPIPIDTLYLGANVLLRKKRMIRCVVEKAVFNKFGT